MSAALVAEGALSGESRRREAIEAASGSIPGRRILLLLAAVAVGAAAFFMTVGESPQRAWGNVWYNFLFWTALAQAGVIFGAILQAAKGHWGKDFRRIAEGAGAFLPISLLVFIDLYFGAEHIFPWVGPVEGHINRQWLTVDGIFLRNGALLTVMVVASGLFLWHSLRPDARFLEGRYSGWRAVLVGRLTRNWRGDEEEAEHSRSKLSSLAPLLILMWITAFTLLAVDMAMSLLPGALELLAVPRPRQAPVRVRDLLDLPLVLPADRHLVRQHPAGDELVRPAYRAGLRAAARPPDDSHLRAALHPAAGPGA
jgi:hypothetical protein